MVLISIPALALLAYVFRCLPKPNIYVILSLWPVTALFLVAAAQALLAVITGLMTQKRIKDPGKRAELQEEIWFYEGYLLSQKSTGSVEVPYNELSEIEAEAERFVIKLKHGIVLFLPFKNFVEGNSEEFYDFVEKRVEAVKQEKTLFQAADKRGKVGGALQFRVMQEESLHGLYAVKLCEFLETREKGGFFGKLSFPLES